MADQNLPQLTEATGIVGADIIYVVVDPSGTPLDRKITVSNLVTSIDGLISHNNLTDLNSGDPHTAYAALDGRGSNQTLHGGASTGNLNLYSNPSNNGDINLDNFFTIKGGTKIAIGPVTFSGTHTNAIAIRNGTASVALTDAVVIYAADFAAGDSRLNFKSETGNNVVVGNGQVRADTFVSLIATGTAPFTVSSTTVVTNLNADKLDGKDAPSGDIVGTSDTQTLTNKTITSPTFSGTFAGTYTIGGTVTFPSTVVTTTGSQTLTNKTLTSPIISQISNTGTLTLPTSTDTLVGRATTDTLTGKTINVDSTNIVSGLDSSGTMSLLPSNVFSGRIYRPTDGLLALRCNGVNWSPLDRDGRILTDPLTSLRSTTYRWTLTGSGTNEYACELSTGGNPSLTQPATLFIDGTEATSGTVGSLSAGTWGWGNYSGFNTVVVRLSDGTDPDSKGYGYIKADAFSWLVKGNMTASIVRNHLYISSTSNGATLTCRMRAMNVPSTPYTLYAYMFPGYCVNATLSHMGLGWSDGTAFSSIGRRTYNRTCYVTHMTNSTTFSADSASPDDEAGPNWLAVRDDGTNRYFMQGSVPDYNYMNVLYSIGRTNFLTPTKVGIIDLRNSSLDGSWFPGLHFGS